MDVRSLSGTSGVSSLDDHFKIENNNAKVGKFDEHTVAIGTNSVVNPSELGAIFSTGKSLSQRQVAIPAQK